jgi:arylsulfatase A-like enzyme
MRVLALLVALLLAATSQPEPLGAQDARPPSARKPNVVLIIMDDMGYGDLGSYGARDVRTLHIDRLARDGVRLSDAYANGPVCTPTRAALISGRYQQRVGLEWVLTLSPADRELGLAVTGTSLPALLKANGYATGLMGKWHLGWKPEFGPNAHGFDEFYGFLSGSHDYYTGAAAPANPDFEASPDLYENAAPVQPAGYLTDEISRRAVRFITEHATSPFFLEVAYNAVHWPFQPPDRPPTVGDRPPPQRPAQMPGDSVPATREDYVRMLERADQGVGEILATLDRLGLARSTLVIFTNDNGGEWLSRNAPLFHRKGTLWEGGIRVPLILRWPGVLPAGKTSGQVAITMDLTASILVATGTPTPAGYRSDGIDLLPVLAGTAPLRERRLFWRIAQASRQQRAVRSGNWKLLIDAGQLLLFDLAADPGEHTDLAARHPDVVARLQRLVTEWENDVGQPRPAGSTTRH